MFGCSLDWFQAWCSDVEFLLFVLLSLLFFVARLSFLPGLLGRGSSS
uniref:Uncharacterized protein n=1 Tax=Anguilla anguilla TaxID=7936 RepID=A0A0E9VRL0_ANGAN